jgi:hypothetical protein
MITTTELLDFLCKAQKLTIFDVTFYQNDEGYIIILNYDWYGDGELSNKIVFIDNEGNSTWGKGDYDFETMNGILGAKLEEKLQKEIKAEKRQELISRLTDEEKELLGVK